MKTSNKALVQMIVSQCKNYGIRHIVFSPGSRNAPFAISFDNDPFFETHIIHDERVAGFYAIGIAQVLNEPVAVCCTSGSAVVNYFPAVTEAFYRKIPLLILSADRPKDLINKGHGQTIMQDFVFGNHTKNSASFEDITFEKLKALRYPEACQKHLSTLFLEPKGPVHFNIHLDEPLYESLEQNLDFSIKPLTESIPELFETNPEFIQKINGKNTIVLCGQNADCEGLNRELVHFNQNTNVVVLNENTSGINDSSFINCIDRTLNGISVNEHKDFVPDVLITIGDAIVSKKIKAFFIQNPPGFHIAINHSAIGIDLFHCLGEHIKTDPSTVFKVLNTHDLQRNTTNFEGKWKTIDFVAKDRLSYFFKTEKTTTDIQVFDALNQNIEENSLIHLANSSVVRYMQLFDPIKSVRYLGNRGTSGIDGSMSTAVGSATALPNQKHVFISGDVSFIYDSNSMWINPFPENLKIIVIDNQGGGIFRIIDGASTSNQLETFFEAQHSADVKKIAEGYGLSVIEINELKYFEITIQKFIQNSTHQMLLIKTDRVENPLALRRLFKYLKND